MVIDKLVLDVIERGYTKDNKFYLPNEQLERKLYLKVNKVLDALGGKWNRKEKAHLFEKPISDALDSVLLTGEVIDMKKEFGFFETPPELAQRLVGWACIQPYSLCLEPSAGKGNIADVMQPFANYKVYCIEILPQNVIELNKKYYKVFEEDFLTFETKRKFDRIVMNPPFAKQADITHVTKALSHLKKDGILVSVMSAGIKFRSNKKTRDFWELLEGYTTTLLDLPEGSFKVSDTAVNTVAIKVKRKLVT